MADPRAARGLDVATLAALCDVFVPAVRAPAAIAHDPHRFFALTASDAGTADQVAALLPVLLEEDELDDLGVLLDVLRRLRIRSLPPAVAGAALAGIARVDADAERGIRRLRQLTQVVHHGGIAADGTNPTWSQMEYPGPPAVEPPPSDRLAVVAPPAAARTRGRWHLHADAVVVGSGAGGGVIAARLAAAGLDVVVLEAGGDRQEEDFPSDELGALRDLYWRSGLATTEDDNVVLVAGATLGGGTTVNWSNWVDPPAHVRQEWADDHGLDGVDGPDFDDDLVAVTQRVGATDERTRANGPNQRLLEGAKALGWDVTTTVRNVDPDLEDDRATGATGFGDRSGAKQGSLRTWLRDAVAAGARVVTDCRVDAVTTAGDHATGVAAVWTDPDGDHVDVAVTAPTIVVAAGALETPGVLLRSGIGGPAAGQHLRLHPVPTMLGVYDEPQRGHEGPPQGVVVDEFAATWAGHGYLLECGHWHPGLLAGGMQWPDPRDVKLVMSRFGRIAPFLAVVRERGAGSVTLDERGRVVVRHPLDDPLDVAVIRRAVGHMIEAHVAAGARTIIDPASGRRWWRRGTPVEEFVAAASAAPLGAGSRPLFSAHQMGSARMGRDPATSVADGDGQLHDVTGVWIGDASAFPTAVGSNPMLTVMALAHRTATRILARR